MSSVWSKTSWELQWVVPTALVLSASWPSFKSSFPFLSLFTGRSAHILTLCLLPQIKHLRLVLHSADLCPCLRHRYRAFFFYMASFFSCRGIFCIWKESLLSCILPQNTQDDFLLCFSPVSRFKAVGIVFSSSFPLLFVLPDWWGV